ncbi:MAG: cupin domain-containing protein [Phaeodactylibacter sp.]|nr:cupin domain-containing protein [Phaeodactylibacter sp.]
MKTETHHFEDDGKIPNNPNLPLIVYRQALEEGTDAAACKARFRKNGWTGAWVNGIYSFHHYHSTAHEVLGVVSGQAEVALGGPEGITTTVKTGDVIIIPAGVGHCNKGASSDFQVVGAYPDGQDWDLCRGEPGERPEKVENIKEVPPPEKDPVFGTEGQLSREWGL